MRHTTRHHGMAAIMALVFLVLGATLTVLLYTMLQSSAAMTRNGDNRRRAAWAAESGLDYLVLMLTRISKDQTIEGKTPEELLNALRAELPNQLSGNPRIDEMLDQSNRPIDGTIQIGSIPLDASASFSATIQPKVFGESLSDPDAVREVRIAVTGVCGLGTAQITRTIGMDAQTVSMAWNPKRYGIMSKGQMSLPTSANGGVYYYNGTSLDQNKQGEAKQVPGGWVLLFPGDAVPTTATFPTYPAQLYEKLNSFHWNTFDRNATNLTNVRIPPGTTWNPGQSVTITGILYVGYGSSITFDSNKSGQVVTIKGAIVWEPFPANTAPTTQTLTLGRRLEVQNPTTNRNAELETVLGTDNPYTKLLNGDVIAAPQTDLGIEPGDDADGIKHFNGGLHVRNVTGQGSGAVLKKAPNTGGMVINQGGITAEGTVNLQANLAFCVLPPDNGGAIIDADRYRLAFEATTYWEK